MDSNEQLVREKWESVTFEDHTQCCGGPDSYRVRMGDTTAQWAETEFAAWSTAADFTRAHLEEIRCANQDCFSIDEQIDSNVEIIRTMDSIDAPFAVCLGEDLARLGRTLARLQAVRDDLKRGLVVDTQAHDKWHEGGRE